MDAPAVPPATVAADLPCLRCGYNLRGQPTDAPCPECGLAAHRSLLAGAALADCPPRWVATVAAGAAVTAVAYLGPIVFTVAMNAETAIRQSWYAPSLVAMTFLTLHAAGAFLITRREPGRRGRAPWDRPAAWALRLLSLGPVVALPWFLYLVMGPWPGPSRHEVLLAWLNAALIPCPALALTRVNRLMVRVGRPRVAEHAAIAGCGLSVAIAAAVVIGLTTHAYRGFPWIIVAIATGFACYFWSLWILFAAARELRAATRQARAAWRAADAAAAPAV
jgi:hypothetical protein